jgi:hypothetical protein
MLRCFDAAVQEKLREDPTLRPVEALNALLLKYNQSTTAKNATIEGYERAAMQFLLVQNATFHFILDLIWKEYKVKESPVNAILLGKPFLRSSAPPRQEVGALPMHRHGVYALSEPVVPTKL